MLSNLDFNKNDKQAYFNQIRGEVTEINNDTDWCSLTLKVGHENCRFVNLVAKKINFDKYVGETKIGDKVCVFFYLTSKFKSGRYYTSAHILQVVKL